MSKRHEPDKPVYTYPLNKARTSNRTFEEAKRACGGKLYTIDEFRQGLIDELNKYYKENGLL